MLSLMTHSCHPEPRVRAEAERAVPDHAGGIGGSVRAALWEQQGNEILAGGDVVDSDPARSFVSEKARCLIVLEHPCNC